MRLLATGEFQERSRDPGAYVPARLDELKAQPKYWANLPCPSFLEHLLS